MKESNLRQANYEFAALPTELIQPLVLELPRIRSVHTVRWVA